jgi:hypothetical protein
MADNLPLSLFERYRGDTISLALSLIDPDSGEAFDPTGWALLFSLKLNPSEADLAALVQKSSVVGGFEVTAAAAGAVTLTLVPADTAGLERDVPYQFDVQAQNATTGAVKTVCRGSLTLSADITNGVSLSIPTTTTNPDTAYTWENIPDKPDAIIALEALTPAADKIPYFTGPDEASQTDLKAYGRELIGSEDAASAREVLELEDVDNTSDADKPVSTAQAAAIAVVQANVDAHEARTDNPHSVTKAQVGLGSADNTSDADKPVSTAQAAAIADVQVDVDAHEAQTDNPHSVTKAQVGLGNADNTSDAGKPVSTAQAAAIAVVQADVDAHEARTDNPHSVTKAQVGLGSADNTSDAGKPVSTAQAAAIAVVQADVDAHEARTDNPHSVTKAQVGLGSADNTSDAGKPVSTAQAAAIAVVQADVDAHEARTDNPHSVTKAQVGLGSADNTSDADKPVSTAAQAALDLKAPLASPALTGAPTAPTAITGDNTTKIATTQFVTSAIADLLDSAPSALNTLNELAAALGDDPNFATTVTNSLAGKLAKSANLSDLLDAATARTNLGVEIGTNVQAWNATLDAVSAGTYLGSTSITTLGTIATGVWNGSVVAGQYGGTGVANTGKTITLGGNLTTSGAFATTLTVTALTSVTLPTSGTLATLAGAESLTNKTYNGNTWTAGTGVLTIAAAKTFTVSNTLTLAGTDSSTLNIGGGGTLGSAAFTAASAYEVPLAFSTGLTRATNTITVNADAGLPSQTGNSGKILTTNGTVSSWSSYLLSGTSGKTYTFPATDATLARTDDSNSFSGTQTFGGTISVAATNSLSWQGGTNLTVSRRSNGKGNTWATTDANDYTCSLFRNSIPAAGAGISALEFEGLDAAGSSVAYALFAVSAPTVTAGASSGQLDFGLQKSGTFTPQWKYVPALSRFYNSYTSEAVFESLDIDWNANIARIGTNQGGGGTARDLQLGVGGAYYWQLSAATGALFPTGSNATDIGTASPLKMVRTVYVGTRIVLGNSTSEAGFIHARDTNGTMVQLNNDLTAAATAVNTGAWKSANWGFSAVSGGASFLGGALTAAGAGSFGGQALIISNAKLQAAGTSDPRVTVKATDASTAGIFLVPNNNANLGWTVRATASATPALEFFSEASVTALSLNYSTGAATFAGSIAAGGAITAASTLTSTSGFVVVGDGTAATEVKLNRGTTAQSNPIRWYTAGTQNWFLGSAATGTNTNLEIYSYGAGLAAATFSNTTGALTLGASITTAAPSGGSAAPWKLGGYSATAPTPTGKIRVEVSGAAYLVPAEAV